MTPQDREATERRVAELREDAAKTRETGCAYYYDRGLPDEANRCFRAAQAFEAEADRLAATPTQHEAGR